MRNNLAAAALRLCPTMGPVLATLRERAEFAMVSGSGSTCFGLFGDEIAAKETAEELSERDRWAAPGGLTGAAHG